jgi:hypothetical protein
LLLQGAALRIAEASSALYHLLHRHKLADTHATPPPDTPPRVKLGMHQQLPYFLRSLQPCCS